MNEEDRQYSNAVDRANKAIKVAVQEEDLVVQGAALTEALAGWVCLHEETVRKGILEAHLKMLLAQVAFLQQRH